ncbi:hypothetical protein [Methylobacterium sp. DCY52]|jgi:membrane associated rhomboid family serine protease|uniref:hypothetical protein n=1 Tax=Methylobacterium sp. DCY52 TaxID=739139 RepID=UPI0031455DC3
MLNAFQIAGLVNHALVFLIGVGAILGLVPLARGRRSAFGLVLMAGAMTIVVLEPRLQLGAVGVGAHVVGFLSGLWLLLGPATAHRRR